STTSRPILETVFAPGGRREPFVAWVAIHASRTMLVAWFETHATIQPPRGRPIPHGADNANDRGGRRGAWSPFGVGAGCRLAGRSAGEKAGGQQRAGAAGRHPRAGRPRSGGGLRHARPGE